MTRAGDTSCPRDRLCSDRRYASFRQPLEWRVPEQSVIKALASTTFIQNNPIKSQCPSRNNDGGAGTPRSHAFHGGNRPTCMDSLPDHTDEYDLRRRQARVHTEVRMVIQNRCAGVLRVDLPYPWRCITIPF